MQGGSNCAEYEQRVGGTSLESCALAVSTDSTAIYMQVPTSRQVVIDIASPTSSFSMLLHLDLRTLPRRRDLPLKLPNCTSFDVVLEGIDLSLGELARRHAPLEQDVEFGVGAAARLGDAEVGVDDREEACSSPEEAGVVALRRRSERVYGERDGWT